MPVYLMYHEIELPGRTMCQGEPGYVRYVVKASAFQSQLKWLKENGWRGLSVGQALAGERDRDIVLTFDDGCETDLIAAAPLLGELSYNATFYITVGFLGNRGFLSQAQLRELSDQGFEIGCHSMTHPYLSDLSAKELHHEIADAKTALEQITQRPVNHFSCPGGRWDDRVVEMAKNAGYQSLTTSRMVRNSPRTNPFELGRVVVMRGTDAAGFQRLCQGRGLWQKRLQDSTRVVARQLLGNRIYERLRARMLG
jgi:peptidoglycan/xylan/chitin deacetylase (PgdA/CDA1 family)